MSAFIGTSGLLSYIGRLFTTYPASALLMFNQSTTGVSANIFKQGTSGSDRFMFANLGSNGSDALAIHRNVGGAPSSAASLTFNRSTGTWYAMRVRFNSVSSIDITLGAVANFASSSVTVTDDIALFNSFDFGDGFLGMLAELFVYDGVAVSDANYTAYRAGTIFGENIAGNTMALNLLTVPAGATSVTADTGQVFNIAGVVTQGSSHPISRTVSTPVSFSGTVPTRNGVTGASVSFDNAAYFAGNLTPFVYSNVGAALPTGLSLNSSTGVISGTPTSVGTTTGIIIRATDTGGNTAQTNSYSIAITAPTPATALTLAGPASGAVGAASSAFTVALSPTGGTVSGTVVVTPADGGAGGTFTPSTRSLTTGAPSGTFTYTPSSAGAKTISVSNNGGLSNPASIAYTATSAGTLVTDAWINNANMLRANEAYTGTWYSGGVVGATGGTATIKTGTLSSGAVATLTGLPAGSGFFLGKSTDGGIFYQAGTIA